MMAFKQLSDSSVASSSARSNLPAVAFRAGLLAASILTSSVAFAQTSSDDQSKDGSQNASGGLTEIVVTAQRREERLQDTPIAISAISAQDLERASTRDITDLTARVPGLVVGGKLTGGGNQPITLRGVTGQTVLTGADTAVSIYIDGVYLSKPDSAFFGLADVERIEVLRGPQGTLYGRNATAGAINIITRKPSSDQWQGSVDASYGNYDSYSVKGYLSGPIAHGLAASASVSATGNGGYFVNSANGKRENSVDSVTGRLKLRYGNDAGNFDATLSYDKTSEKSDLAYFQYGYGPLSSPTYVGVSNPSSNYVDWSDYNGSKTVSQGASLTVNYRPSSNWTVTSVSGWRKLSVNGAYSISPKGGFAAIGGQVIQSINHSDYGPAISQELRAVYQSKRLNFTTGITYFSEDVESQFGGAVKPVNQPVTDLNTVVTAPIVTTQTKSMGIFAQADWEFVDKVTLTAGIRGNREKREMHEVWPALATKPTLDANVKDDKFIPKLGLSYRPNKRLMFYGTFSEGYQAPGQSYSATPPPAGVILQVAPEKLLAYEAGFKSEWLDGRVRFNLSAFHYNYNPLQVRVTVGLNQFKIVNAIAKIDGLEAEAAVAVADGLVLNGNVVWLNARYTNFCDSPVPYDSAPNCALPGTTGNTGVSRNGNPLNQAPDLQFNLAANYTKQLSDDLRLKLDASLAHQSEFYSGPAKIDPYLRSKPLTLVNLRAGIETSRNLEFYAFVRNLTDSRSQGAILYTGLVGNIISVGQITPPRTYGLGLSYRFGK